MELNLYRLNVIIKRYAQLGSITGKLERISPSEFNKFQSQGEMFFNIDGRLKYQAKQGKDENSYLLLNPSNSTALKINNLSALLDHISREQSPVLCKQTSFYEKLAEMDISDKQGEIEA